MTAIFIITKNATVITLEEWGKPMISSGLAYKNDVSQ